MKSANRIEVLHLFRCFTHTPHRSGVRFSTSDRNQESSVACDEACDRAACDGDVELGVPSFKRQCCKLIRSSILNSVAGQDDSSTRLSILKGPPSPNSLFHRPLARSVGEKVSIDGRTVGGRRAGGSAYRFRMFSGLVLRKGTS